MLGIKSRSSHRQDMCYINESYLQPQICSFFGIVSANKEKEIELTEREGTDYGRSPQVSRKLHPFPLQE